MKTEREVRALIDEAEQKYRECDASGDRINKEYMGEVVSILEWVLGIGDDPLEDYREDV